MSVKPFGLLRDIKTAEEILTSAHNQCFKQTQKISNFFQFLQPRTNLYNACE